MVFVDFVEVEQFTPISRCFEKTGWYVCCLSAEKKDRVRRCASVRRWFEGCLKDRRNRRTSTQDFISSAAPSAVLLLEIPRRSQMMLLIGSLSTGESIFALLLRGSNRTLICSCISVRRQPITCRKAAPYALLVSVSRQKCYGVTSGNSPFVILSSAHLFLRYAYRSGTISSPLSARWSTSQQTYKYGACKLPIYAVQGATDRKSTKSIEIEIPHIVINAESPARYFYFWKSLFRSFVILTIIILSLNLLSFIVTYRQLYKKCFNSITPQFQGVLTHKKFVRIAAWFPF